ncbi:FCD domain-containing protein [Prosthecomicrobium pneumaticum]|uniref:GntR family transcriptional repressor for pyruvate dehydrogenase complex n=1 Tax=Prosthecomicrobium pneumaticum TaxID=81895 RepID=A0A7W9FPM9_9HYPH|nr:GntR family transcriptional repressor for pyruvate dehydrogenase complex [Prosthecomicrobium pneumaticum]
MAKAGGPETGAGERFAELAAGGEPGTQHDFGGSLDRRPIAEQVANRIMGMIKSGNLRPGDRLPTEQQMGIAFSISRPPLREALKALTLMGVLESRQGGRYTVTDLSPSRLIAPFNVMLSVGDYEVDEHFEARAVVELDIVRMCTLRATPEEKRRIAVLAADGRAFHEDPVAFRLLDIEFHQALDDGAHNRLLSTMAQGLYDVGLDVRRLASTFPGVIETSVGQHIAVADAVLAGDAEAAATAYRRHLEHVRDTTIQAMTALKRQK